MDAASQARPEPRAPGISLDTRTAKATVRDQPSLPHVPENPRGPSADY